MLPGKRLYKVSSESGNHRIGQIMPFSGNGALYSKIFNPFCPINFQVAGFFSLPWLSWAVRFEGLLNSWGKKSRIQQVQMPQNLFLLKFKKRLLKLRQAFNFQSSRKVYSDKLASAFALALMEKRIFRGPYSTIVNI